MHEYRASNELFAKGFNLYISIIKYYPYSMHMIFSAQRTIGFLFLQQETVFFQNLSLLSQALLSVSVPAFSLLDTCPPL